MVQNTLASKPQSLSPQYGRLLWGSVAGAHRDIHGSPHLELARLGPPYVQGRSSEPGRLEEWLTLQHRDPTGQLGCGRTLYPPEETGGGMKVQGQRTEGSWRPGSQQHGGPLAFPLPSREGLLL